MNAPPGLTISNSVRIVFMGLIHFSEWTAVISLNNINQLICVVFYLRYGLNSKIVFRSVLEMEI
jgi:hypothetical protein